MNIRNAIAIAVCAIGLTVPAYAASIVGETVEIEYAFGVDGNDLYPAGGTGNFTVGAGVETNIFGQWAIDVAGEYLTITNTGSGAFIANAFNGFRITDILDGFGDFTSAYLFSSNVGLGPVVTFDANALFVNFGGAGSTQIGDVAVVKFTTADEISPVPLPAGLPLLLIGLGALGYTRTRQQS